MDTVIPLLFGLLSLLGFMLTTALVYLIIKPAPGETVSGKQSHLPARNLHAP
ncbi:MAG: hypothetical protein M1537_06430 [Nitrospirae bacterium]|nr:MAG: hypothetical protein D084_Lepto4C00518G0001 [Leptospirillum sp. Group IV 'UBA BS']MCL4485948.1 hypothetical protein [Nitrospirota bacterium]MCL5285639.1 hypothetical protein [Nitrospirota bacterium]